MVQHAELDAAAPKGAFELLCEAPKGIFIQWRVIKHRRASFDSRVLSSRCLWCQKGQCATRRGQEQMVPAACKLHPNTGAAWGGLGAAQGPAACQPVICEL